jgi:alkylhydroperoxidase/carboxymuconolactone decarboxylase family protein YurZ
VSPRLDEGFFVLSLPLAMIISLIDKQANKFNKEGLLSAICAAAALREKNLLHKLLLKAKEVGIKTNALYESLLQNYLFTGYPSAMIALKILKEYFPNLKKTFNEGWDLNRYRMRGVRNCKKVYGRKYNRLISNVGNFSPELSDWLVLEGYGKVMGRKGLSFKQRELNNVAVLTVLRFEDQLYSHINGAIRANASLSDVKRIINNLKIFGRYELIDFGLKVLNRYKMQSGTG